MNIAQDINELQTKRTEEILAELASTPASDMTPDLFRDAIRGAVRSAAAGLILREVQELCGNSHERNNPSGCKRAGSRKNVKVYNGDREERATVPRVRENLPDGSSKEVTLKTLAALQCPKMWEEAIMRTSLLGVSTRNGQELNEAELRKCSKSKISKIWAEHSAHLVQEVNESSLTGFKPVILMLDGIVLAEDLHVIVSLGINADGDKKLLGFQKGSSESYEVSLDLLRSLQRRGLAPVTQNPLVIIDGSAALRKAVKKTWPAAEVQRCLVHKERNLYSYLPKKDHPKLRGLFSRLRKAQGAEAAKEIAAELREWLEPRNSAALKSLEEVGEDLLTVFRLDIPATLNSTVLSTNHIENIMGNFRRHFGRVTRWRKDTDMADRWMASGCILANRGFRRIKGYKDLPKLIDCLRQKLIEAEKTAEQQKQAC